MGMLTDVRPTQDAPIKTKVCPGCGSLTEHTKISSAPTRDCAAFLQGVVKRQREVMEEALNLLTHTELACRIDETKDGCDLCLAEIKLYNEITRTK